MKYVRYSKLTPYYCGFSARGETAEDVKQSMVQHVTYEHTDVLSRIPLRAKVYFEEEIDHMLEQA